MNLPTYEQLQNWEICIDKYVDSVQDLPVPETGNYYTIKDYSFSGWELEDGMVLLNFNLWRNYELCGTQQLRVQFHDIITIK